MKNKLSLLAIIIFLLVFVTFPSNAKVICDRFEIKSKLQGNILKLSLDTDLPDNTILMISVSRNYIDKRDKKPYVIDYFSEKSTVGKWRSEHEIIIDNKKWLDDLKNNQEVASRVGLRYEIASIEDKVPISMVIPIFQKNSKFGDRNSELSGKAVKINHFPIVEDKKEINYPIDSTKAIERKSFNLDPTNLTINQIYIVSEDTPLMPSYNPPEDWADFQRDILPKNGKIKILKKTRVRNNMWYQVQVVTNDKNKSQGWINSLALLGQSLEAWNP